MNYPSTSFGECNPERFREIRGKTKEFFMVPWGIKKPQFLKYSIHFLIA